eukprot:CAMPEP_0172485456 /NCGR_PEP_ID=MMETSP1066-20121228/13500_1 /TAXON_ID=671091 /ORGANISM="Coscinodiscus wailesii, Strain CCMP2513" /LENGTH=190 /DNA_ID=CAMNT_0013250739 /DNA_START=304 /DNA_END=876 /DNA_ORIENTATION=-
MYPEAVFEMDCMGRFPLHIASKFGASTSVIKHLVKKNPKAAEMQDTSGQTPLHLEFYDYRWKSLVSDSAHHTVKCLCDVAPKSVVLDDKDGMSAIEYAIDEEADMKVIRLLQKTSQSFRKLKISTEDNHKSVKTLEDTRKQPIDHNDTNVDREMKHQLEHKNGIAISNPIIRSTNSRRKRLLKKVFSQTA